jgi:hypothetical protein
MACPLFLPADSLGEYHTGECAAARGEALTDETLRRCCNAGYARGLCVHATTTDCDSIQFVLKADRGGAIELGWAMERNHHPLAVGSLTMPLAPVTPLEFQARAFGTAYLRQRPQAH